MKIEVTQEPKALGKRKSKVVKLSVHKNTLEKKVLSEKKRIFQEYFKEVQSGIPSPTDFVILAIETDGSYAASFICSDVKDLYILPEKVKQILTREINKYLDSIEE